MKPENIKIELNESEKQIINNLKDKGELELDILKKNSGLSNNQWDKCIKDLKKKEIVNILKQSNKLFVKLI